MRSHAGVAGRTFVDFGGLSRRKPPKPVCLPTSTAGFPGSRLFVSTAYGDGGPGFTYESDCREHRRRDGCSPLTVRDGCISRDVDTAIGMAQDGITAAKTPWTTTPILLR